VIEENIAVFEPNALAVDGPVEVVVRRRKLDLAIAIEFVYGLILILIGASRYGAHPTLGTIAMAAGLAVMLIGFAVVREPAETDNR
jgi:hypothetical protein